MRRFLHVVGGAAKSWFADNAFAHSAAVSFYTLFSLAPITVIVVTLIGLFFGEDAARHQFLAQVSQLVGRSGASVIQKALAATSVHTHSWPATVGNAVLVVIGATTVFAQLQQSINDLWHVTTKPSKNVWLMLLIKRVISFAMVLTVGFLLLTSLVISTGITTMVELAKAQFANAALVIEAANLLVGVLVVTVLFTLMFKVLADVHIGWREAWGGGFVTALLFTGGRFAIGAYLAHTTFVSRYGAAASLVGLLMWIYYSSAIFFYGVEYVRAHRHQRGLPVIPKPTAVLVRQELARD